MSNIKQVAIEANVSPSTVSRVLNNYDNVTEETRIKVEKACKKLNYKPNAAAAHLRSGKTSTISFVVPEINNPYFAKALKGVENLAIDKGFKTIVCNTNNNFDMEKKYMEMIIEKSVDGLILATTNSKTEEYNWIYNYSIPVVLFDRKIYELDNKVDLVAGDSYKGAYKLTNHLIKMGHKNVGILTAPLNISTSKERLQGYKDALSNNNIKINTDWIWISQEGKGYDPQLAFELTNNKISELRNMPEAFFVGNNLMALGMFKSLTKNNLKVPEDVAIACFDDLNFSFEINPFFTSMKQPSYKMGQKAAEILIRKIENKDKNYIESIFDSKLYIRQSSKKTFNN